ncbi:hypothetical protein VPHK45_0093 [Vibrio phage K45]
MIRRAYEKTGFAGHFFLHYLLSATVLTIVSTIIANYVSFLNPMSVTEALLYIVLINFSLAEYRIKTIIRKGTNQ